MKKRFDDYLTISDGFVKGIVVLKDKNGNIIFKKENMVVEDGRKYIKEKFMLAAFKDVKTIQENFASVTLNKIKFGSSGSVTEYSSKNLSSHIPLLDKDLRQEDININSDYIRFDATIDNVKGLSGYSIQELGLFLSNDLMFSRISFDPIPVGAGDKYSIEYYVYF